MHPQTESFVAWKGAVAVCAALIAAFSLTGCGGGSGSTGSATLADGPSSGACVPSDPTTSAECGTALISLTDAEGDFVSYTVDVLSVTLRRNDGTTVEMLPATTRLDFAQLTDLSELISAKALVPGDFVGGTIRLDYSHAEIDVEAGGQIVKATAVDASGQPLGVTELQIQLSDKDHLVVTRARTALLSVDFNLSASNQVDTSQSPPAVTVEPFIVGEVSPVDQKDLRVRGTLVGVDTAASSYTVRVRPWHQRDGDHGPFTVHTTDQTTFDVDGKSYIGAAGLQALAGAASGELTVALGTLDVTSHEFAAASVRAGTSVGGNGVDAVEGDVVARSGDSLTVEGAWDTHRDGPAEFSRRVTVLLGADTKVVKATDPGTQLDKDAVSVGQRILAFGQFQAAATAADSSAAAQPVLDATAGRVRMQITRLHGTVNSVASGQLDLTLRAIDRLGIDLFDFAGTGQAGQDAKPADYSVTAGKLGLGGVAAGNWTDVLGFVEPFGAAPPDFAAETIVDRQEAFAVLGIGWGTSGTLAPFVTMEPALLVLDLANPAIGKRHSLWVNGSTMDLASLPGSPSIVPAQKRTIYGIAEPGHVESFADFDAFVDALTSRLGAGEAALSLEAVGSYDVGTNTVNAAKIAVHMLPAK